ncbi:Protein of unknown function [Sporobacter termitidis DSM 10068]|uniref:DUF1015 domain-containing protein n=1 Tax=Sporobacter termitidis DSM 10068 TaxID=1123282 RepID=A0A1M5ZHE6_9FIRM|nr:DUF1015 domain-containing protein [Sporobacter termitidis]SHI23602.1 Protein of unknown function [Sporobacter termitidis DSM 10068]
MAENAFWPADILLPDGTDMTKWSVIACDQFSSEPDYWARVERTAGAAPSTLRLIVPEAYLDRVDTARSAEVIGAQMDAYLRQGLFKKLENSFIYVERTVSDGRVRRGLVGMLDLEAYDFSLGAKTAVRASERTIVSRLPARVDVRRKAPLELPHIMALIDDRDGRVIEPLAEKKGLLEPAYAFELMEGGGAIRGWRVAGDDLQDVLAALNGLASPGGVQIIIGDGNHSLAAAKGYWEELKASLSPSALEGHPARYALVELNNVYDPAIGFEAIHRVVFGADPLALISEMKNALPLDCDGYALEWRTADRRGALTVGARSIGDFIERLQSFLDDYVAKNGCAIDYIHGEEAVEKLAARKDCVGFLLPTMDKSEFFGTVSAGALFPKKSFSIGHARDKRYYLECREIRKAT